MTGTDPFGQPGFPPAVRQGGQAEVYSPPGPSPVAAARRSPALRYERIALVDLLDRLLAGGVVVSGEVRLSIADVDMVHISLRALISSVSSVLAHGPGSEETRRDR